MSGLVNAEERRAVVVGINPRIRIFEIVKRASPVAENRAGGDGWSEGIFHTEDALQDGIVEVAQPVARAVQVGLRVGHVGKDAPMRVLDFLNNRGFRIWRRGFCNWDVRQLPCSCSGQRRLAKPVHRFQSNAEH